MSIEIGVTYKNYGMDVTTIRYRLRDNSYLLKFVIGKTPKTVWVNTKSYTEVVEHLWRMFRLISQDTDTSGVQINIPGTFCGRFGINALTEQCISDIVLTIISYLKNPPKSYHV